jgi:hypothetical protein
VARGEPAGVDLTEYGAFRGADRALGFSTGTGIEKHVCTATVLTGAERDALWNEQESRAPVIALV